MGQAPGTCPINEVYRISTSIKILSHLNLFYRPNDQFYKTSHLCITGGYDDFLHWNGNAVTLISLWSLAAQVLMPIPLTIFRSNSKFDQHLQCFSFKYTLPITTKFCRRHERQCNCRDVCKISLWSVTYILTRAFQSLVESRIRTHISISVSCWGFHYHPRVVSKNLGACCMISENAFIISNNRNNFESELHLRPMG